MVQTSKLETIGTDIELVKRSASNERKTDAEAIRDKGHKRTVLRFERKYNGSTTANTDGSYMHLRQSDWLHMGDTNTNEEYRIFL
jgi:hypothetical protein